MLSGRGLWLGALVIGLCVGLLPAAPVPTAAAPAPTGVGTAAVAAPSRIAAAATTRTVPPELFGMQIRSIGAARPGNLRAGSIRLWDALVSWRRIQPERGVYRWDVLDAAVANAESIGAQEILYTVGVLPVWAASSLEPAIYGPGTATHPVNNADYIAFVTAIASRYKGRITAYQLWNEANLRIFYQGTPAQLAQLVAQASWAIKSIDPAAKIVAPSALVDANGPADPYGDQFFVTFAAELRARGWPVDAVSVHLYAPADRGPGTRARYLRAAKRWFESHGWAGPMWDTETSYGDRRPWSPLRKVYTGKKAATYVARTYIDSMRYGVPRVFWYGWEVDILGVDLTIQGQRTQAGDAFLTISRWMSGASWRGCKKSGRVTTCTMRRDGTRYVIKYASKRTKIRLPSGTRYWESLDGVSHRARGGKRIVLTTSPILIRR